MELDPDAAVLAGDLDALVPTDEAVHARDLAGRIGGVARENVERDECMSFHYRSDLRTSSVTSGRAKKRKGTNVVPRPGET
jgi:hypothetical protein